MEYRLICITKDFPSEQSKLEIEVSRETHSKGLSPFLRKVSVEDLAYSDTNRLENFVLLLNQLGFLRQPFSIQGEVLTYKCFWRVIAECPWQYKQLNVKGSLRKTEISYAGIDAQLGVGKLLHGELYITNIATWKRHIKVRLSYKDSILSFFPKYNAYPCKSIYNDYFLRDKEAEERLLRDINCWLDDNGLDISFQEFDTDRLRVLSERGWKIYVEQNKQPARQLYVQRSNSGIVWFDTDNSTKSQDKIGVRQLLEGYLQGRNYCSVGDAIQLYQSSQIKNVDNKQLAASLDRSGNIENIFVQLQELTDLETEYIYSSLYQRINAWLKPFQIDGVLWLSKMRKNRKGCLLADEMGLGKTLQVIAHLCSIKEPQGPFLIIVPTSLVPNWVAEITKFVPSWIDDISVQQSHPDFSKKIILVSYDVLRLNIEEYTKNDFDTIVIDEAQIIKNRETQRAQKIRQLKAFHKIILTGTPIENSINDIWSHFFILIPEMYSLYQHINISKQEINSPYSVELARKILSPFILRRTKDEVLKELPQRHIKDITVSLSEREKVVYDSVRAVFIEAMSDGTSGRLNSIALEGLLRMRQACVSINLLPKTLYKGEFGPSTKLQKAISLISLFAIEGRKTIVFSQFVQVLKELENYLSEVHIGWEHLYGDTVNRKAAIEHFKQDQEISVFLVSLRAGGNGLNLTEATRIILLDDWWNPAVEEQAFARAHRIGQRAEVSIYRIICQGTVEEKIIALQRKKQNTIELFNTNRGQITIEEIRNLIN